MRLEKKSSGVSGGKTDYEYVFNAKYRINPALPNTIYSNTIASTPGPEIDDINTMHRYRDTIVARKQTESGTAILLPDTYERKMFGAYILFPYHNEEGYKSHRFYKSIEEVNIGGLPFLPSATNLVEDLLNELVSDSPDAAFERATLPRGIEERLAKVDWSKRDVLVGSLRNEDHLAFCLDKKMYFVPASRVSAEQLPIHYISLYQTKAAFGAEARIEYYGEVRSTRRITGAELLDVAEHREVSALESKLTDAGVTVFSVSANAAVTTLIDETEEYILFRIKAWKKLPRPIEPKERWQSTILMNLFLLEHSSQIPELFLQSEAEYRFFTELKRRTEASVINENAETPGFAFGENRVVFENGEIQIRLKNETLGTCAVSAFARRPNAEFRRLMGYVKKMKRK